MKRRNFLSSLVAMFVAPAVVVKAVQSAKPEPYLDLDLIFEQMYKLRRDRQAEGDGFIHSLVHPDHLPICNNLPESTFTRARITGLTPNDIVELGRSELVRSKR